MSCWSAAVEIGEVVSLEDYSMSLDIGVVALDVLSRNQESAGFVPRGFGDRRRQVSQVDARFAERPG
jgi:hypothetical protein